MWQCAIGPIFILSQAQLILTWGEKVEYFFYKALPNAVKKSYLYTILVTLACVHHRQAQCKYLRILRKKTWSILDQIQLRRWESWSSLQELSKTSLLFKKQPKFVFMSTKTFLMMMTFLDNLRVYNLSSTIFKMWGGLDPGLEISKQFFFYFL